MGKHVVNDRVNRSQADSAGDYQDVLAFECRVNGKAVSNRAADADLRSGLGGVEPTCDAAALFD